MPAEPIAEGLFTGPAGELRLIGSACSACGVVTFPAQRSCPACPSVEVEERRLGRRGTLYTWTVQGFRPKPPYAGPEPFEPYGVGYVELPGEVRVEARLTVADPAVLRIGMPMALVALPFGDKLTYAFAPVDPDPAGDTVSRP
ncbi:MAG TPA: OB-fold domain-containing protein [Acidimicrobiia bacterium]|nr:OB-fold domain-containing protein [Acidimicrobiia bacterium]